MNPIKSKALQPVQILKCKGQSFESKADVLAVEAPLEIQLAYGTRSNRKKKSLSVTMRTPGQDFDLVMGFLFSEGIITRPNEIIQMRFVGEQMDELTQENVLLVEFAPNCQFDPQKLKRHFYTASSCGICGKSSIELVQLNTAFILNRNYPVLKSNILKEFPAQLLEAQASFAQTGGLHAAALFDTEGRLQQIREDVGRHNALDKLIGATFKSSLIPLKDKVLMLSGRISFELVQKASMAGIPIIAAVGAPSSLAVELADSQNMTLIGFLRQEQFNVYCGASRVKL